MAWPRSLSNQTCMNKHAREKKARKIIPRNRMNNHHHHQSSPSAIKIHENIFCVRARELGSNTVHKSTALASRSTLPGTSSSRFGIL